ncbi:MAG: AMP-binding protein [Gemmatimonadetes bacterium]|nr:AMP-binding protein [Gemmatimonadota bacterium]
MSHPDANLATRFAERAALHPERTALVEYAGRRVRRVTFGGMAERVAALAAGMREAGIGTGDRVLVLLPPSVDLYVTLLATLHAGAAAVFVDEWPSRARLDAAVVAAAPRAFVGPSRAHLLRLLSPALRRVPVQWLVGRRWFPLSRRGRPAGAGTPAEVGAEHPALITFAPGSGGAPRGTVRTHGALWAEHRALAGLLELTEEDVDLPVLPAFVLHDLLAGVCAVLPGVDPRAPGAVDPEAVHRRMRREGVTTSSGPPAFHERLVVRGAPRGVMVPLRALSTVGGVVYPPLARRLADAVHGTARLVYACDGAGPVAAIEARAMLAAMAAMGEGICAGFPLPGVSTRIIRPHPGPVVLGEEGWAEWEVPRGAVGELVVSGAHGRLNDPEGERATRIRDGERVWHRTGDAARLDPLGRLWRMGRVAERVVRAGSTWWSFPAELRALGAGYVRHAAYLGLADAELGERTVLCVEIPGGQLDDLLRADLSRRLGAIPVDEIHALPRIPRDPGDASRTDVPALRRILAALRRRPAPADVTG